MAGENEEGFVDESAGKEIVREQHEVMIFLFL